MVTRRLSELEPGAKGRVARVAGRGGIYRRLLDMGVVSGTVIEVERLAPLGDPMEIKLKGYHLTLRRAEAANIQVELVQEPVMPLNMVLPGGLVQVVAIRGGRGLQRRLADMGLTPGVPVRVVNSQKPGPVVIEIRGSRLALGRGAAHHIMVGEVKVEND